MKKLQVKKGNEVGRVNIVVVPGIYESSLGAQTCEHFQAQFLNELVNHQQATTTLWLFEHKLNIRDLKSWESYAYEGERLLKELKGLLEDDIHQPLEDSFILVGHKLGVFILKSALIAAQKRQDEQLEYDVLDSTDLLMLLGDPQLAAENRSEWIKLLTECCSDQSLPEHLCFEEAVHCLQKISEDFQRRMYWFSLLQAKGSSLKRQKMKVWRRHKNKDCICLKQINLRKGSTQSKEELIAFSQSALSDCSFSNSSVHFRSLIEAGDTMVYASIKPRRSRQYLLASDESGVETSITDDHCDKSLSDSNSVDSYDDQESSSSAQNNPEIPKKGSPNIESVPLTDTVTEAADDSLRSTSSERTNSSNVILENAQNVVVATDCAPHEQDLDLQGRDTIRPISPAIKILANKTCTSPPVDALNSDDEATSSQPYSTHKFLHFYGRKDILLQMKQILQFEPENLGSHSACVWNRETVGLVLHGIGGSGKTATAVNYMQQFWSESALTFVLRANSRSAIGFSFRQIAVDLGLIAFNEPMSHQNCRLIVSRHLELSHRPWLLIYDNLSHIKDFSETCPRSCLGRVIITTRLDTSKMTDIKDCKFSNVELRQMSVDDSLLLLRSMAPNSWEELETRDVMKIVQLCDGSPLALRTCVDVVTRQQITFKEFIDLLPRSVDDVLIYAKGHKNDVFSLIGLTGQTGKGQSLELRYKLTPQANALHHTLAFLDPEYIDESLLLCLPRRGNSSSRSLASYPTNRKEMAEARSILWHRAAFNVYAGSSISRFLWTRSWTLQEIVLNSCNDQYFKQSFETAASLLLSRWPSPRKLQNLREGYWPEFDHLHSHVTAMSRVYGISEGIESSQSISIRKRQGLLQHLSTDSFLRLLVYSAWYDANRGNTDGDLYLFKLAQTILNASKLRSRDRHMLDFPHPGDDPKLHERVTFSVVADCCAGLTNSLTCQRLRPIRRRPGWTTEFVDVQDLDSCRVVRRPINSTISPQCIALCLGREHYKTKPTGSRNVRWVKQPFSVDNIWGPEAQEVIVSARNCGVRYLWIPGVCRIWRDDESDEDTFDHDLTNCSMLVLDPSFINADARFVLGTKPKPMPLSGRTSIETAVVDANGTEENDTEFPASISHNADREIDNGITMAINGDVERAVACFSKVRDTVSVFQAPSRQHLELFAKASMYLCHLHCGRSSWSLADAILHKILDLTQADSKYSLPNVLKGQLQLLNGFIRQHMQPDDSAQTIEAAYLEALRLFQSALVAPETGSDYVALARIKLAAHCQLQGRVKEAREYLQSAINHFEGQVGIFEDQIDNDQHLTASTEGSSSSSMESGSMTGMEGVDAAQAQLARALRLQALVLEQQGNKTIARIKLAAAKEALVELLEKRKQSTKDKNALTLTRMEGDDEEGENDQSTSFELRDFERAIRQFWMR